MIICVYGGGGGEGGGGCVLGGWDMSVGVWKMCKTIFVLGPVIKIILKKKNHDRVLWFPSEPCKDHCHSTYQQ